MSSFGWNQGYTARWNGAERDENPYDTNSEEGEHADWDDGWLSCDNFIKDEQAKGSIT